MKRQFIWLDNLSIVQRIKLLIVTITTIIVLLSVLNFVSLYNFVYEERLEDTKNVVVIAQHVVQFYYEQEQLHLMPEETAKSTALAVLDSIRYDNNNYVFVYNYDHVLLANATRPDLVGVNRKDAKSPDGVFYVQEGVKAARAGGGFYSYLFNAGGASTSSRKIAYALGFDPWQWMIGSGSYIDEIDTFFIHRIIYTILLALGSLSLCIYLISKISVSALHSVNTWLKETFDKVKTK